MNFLNYYYVYVEYFIFFFVHNKILIQQKVMLVVMFQIFQFLEIEGHLGAKELTITSLSQESKIF
ncbi:hypothetical protein Mgra_00004507 [Meloidogyne graminicola]|uniref:Uncharacterized protein n=1 Tax=Meloidogyne graminicola TaxID=189291 RepID=A0A8S9ZSE2_9BILA|nr:hypothetical protein Mgra_00004507 [Meloidogyne graminicola]